MGMGQLTGGDYQMTASNLAGRWETLLWAAPFGSFEYQGRMFRVDELSQRRDGLFTLKAVRLPAEDASEEEEPEPLGYTSWALEDDFVWHYTRETLDEDKVRLLGKVYAQETSADGLKWWAAVFPPKHPAYDEQVLGLGGFSRRRDAERTVTKWWRSKKALRALSQEATNVPGPEGTAPERSVTVAEELNELLGEARWEQAAPDRWEAFIGGRKLGECRAVPVDEEAGAVHAGAGVRWLVTVYPPKAQVYPAVEAVGRYRTLKQARGELMAWWMDGVVVDDLGDEILQKTEPEVDLKPTVEGPPAAEREGVEPEVEGSDGNVEPEVEADHLDPFQQLRREAYKALAAGKVEPKVEPKSRLMSKVPRCEWEWGSDCDTPTWWLRRDNEFKVGMTRLEDGVWKAWTMPPGKPEMVSLEYLKADARAAEAREAVDYWWLSNDVAEIEPGPPGPVLRDSLVPRCEWNWSEQVNTWYLRLNGYYEIAAVKEKDGMFTAWVLPRDHTQLTVKVTRSLDDALLACDDWWVKNPEGRVNGNRAEEDVR